MMEHQVSDALVNTWALILTLMLTVYAALDGFDLGVGILSLIERDTSRKILMMEGLNGIWDANETWLVLIGGTLFGAFPLAYAAVLQALYIPVLLMLFALIFRGVAFEFRLYSTRQGLWLLAFGAGSLIAALAQGLALGALLSGIPGDLTEPGVIWSWATPFSLLTALMLITVYVLLGSAWLLRKVDEPFLGVVYRRAWGAVLLLLTELPLFFYALSQIAPHLVDRWLSEPLWFGLLGACIDVPLLMLILNLLRRNLGDCFFWAVLSLVMTVIALVACFFPEMLPGVMTLHMAASSTRTLEFMLMAIGGLLPLIFGYNIYQYYIFRGRITAGH